MHFPHSWPTWHNLLSPNIRGVALDTAAAWHCAILTQASAVGMNSFPRVKLYMFQESVRQSYELMLTSSDTLALWKEKTEVVQHSKVSEKSVRPTTNLRNETVHAVTKSFHHPSLYHKCYELESALLWVNISVAWWGFQHLVKLEELRSWHEQKAHHHITTLLHNCSRLAFNCSS